MSPRLPSTTRSKRGLWVLLAAAILVFAISLPWQKRQWDEANRLKAQTQAQEQQITQLQTRNAAPVSSSPLQQAEQLLQTGQTRQADQALRSAETRLRADAPSEIALRLSDLFQKAGRIDRAYHWARVAAKKSPNGLEELVRLGTLELQLGHADESRDTLLKAQKSHPDSASALIAFALYLNQLYDGPRAREYLLRAIALQPENWQARLLLVQQYESQSEFEKARQAIEQILSVPAAQDIIWTQLADLYLQQAEKQPASREASLTKASDALDTAQQHADASDPGILYRRGQIRLMQDDPAGARKLWEPLLTTNPDYLGLKTSLGRVLIQTGDKAKGAALIQDDAKRAAVESEYAQLVLAAGVTPPNKEAHRALARWCQAHGRLPRARLEWELVQEIAPGDPEAARALASGALPPP